MLSLSQPRLYVLTWSGHKNLNMGFARARQAFETVSTFPKRRNQPPIAVRIGKFQHQQSKLAEVIVGQQKLAKRIADAGIEASQK